MRKKIIIKVLIVSISVLSAAGFYIYHEYNRTLIDTEKLQADYSLKATDMIGEFVANEKLSNEKYWDKVINVQGNIKEIIRDEKGMYALSLGDTASMSSVHCTIDSLYTSDAKALKPGDHVEVKGICSGYKADELLGSDVVLVRCFIQKK